eukprot:381296-Prymnesium_polylepis.1
MNRTKLGPRPRGQCIDGPDILAGVSHIATKTIGGLVGFMSSQTAPLASKLKKVAQIPTMATPTPADK